MAKPRSNGQTQVATEVSPGLLAVIEKAAVVDGVPKSVIMRRAAMHLFNVNADGSPKGSK